MYALIVSIIILVAFLLILVVLAQNPKGGGLSSQFGGAGTQQIMGVKKTGDFLEKMTWGLAIALLALTLSTNFVGQEEIQTLTTPSIENATELNIPNPSLAPSEGAENLGLEEDSVN